MKKLLLLFIILIVLSSVDLRAQNNQTKLNQFELMKQFVGYWKAEIGKDTIFIVEQKPFYSGFDIYLRIESKGKIIFEQKTLMGYNKENDKIFEAAVNNGSDQMILMVAWFTSENKCEEVLYKDMPDPENAKYKWVYEFKSPDLLIWTDLVDNKPINTYTFHKEKTLK